MQPHQERALHVPRTAVVIAVGDPFQDAVDDDEIESILAERRAHRVAADDIDVRESVLREPALDEPAPPGIPLQRHDVLERFGEALRDDPGAGADVEGGPAPADVQRLVEGRLLRVGEPEPLAGEHGEIETPERLAPSSGSIHRRDQPLQLVVRQRALTSARKTVEVSHCVERHEHTSSHGSITRRRSRGDAEARLTRRRGVRLTWRRGVRNHSANASVHGAQRLGSGRDRRAYGPAAAPPARSRGAARTHRSRDVPPVCSGRTSRSSAGHTSHLRASA